MSAVLHVDIQHMLGSCQICADFSLDSARFCGVFGPQASGKTALLDLITGGIKPHRGRIELAGDVLFDASKNIFLPIEKRRIGYLFEDPCLFPHLDVRANLLYGMMRRRETERFIRFDHVLDLLELEELLEKTPNSLTFYEQQRVQLGRALLASPNLLVMDEVLTGLDGASRAKFAPLIGRVKIETGIPNLWASRSLDMLITHCDDLIVLEDGEAVICAPVGEVMRTGDIPAISGTMAAGAVLNGVVSGTSTDQGAKIAVNGVEGCFISCIDGMVVDQGVKLYLRAHDVHLAKENVSQSSFANVFEAEVIEIRSQAGGSCEIVLSIGVEILAHISEQTRRKLGLAQGDKVYALMTAEAIDITQKF